MKPNNVIATSKAKYLARSHRTMVGAVYKLNPADP
jgi:hypothetical protein